VFQTGAPFFFRLWGVPFVAAGLYLTAGRFFYDAYRRAGTTYAVTNRRVILLSGVFYRNTRSLNLSGLDEVTVSQRRDGSGDIALGSPPLFAYRYVPSGWPGASAQPPMLEALPNAREVYDIIREAQRRAE